MPNRVIREGWLESDRIDSLDPQAERFFLRLCLRSDDFGRFHAAPQLLKSMLFPLKEDIRGADMTRCLAACEKAGLVRCYEVAGKRFLEIDNFDQRLRAKVSKFPPMTDGCLTSVSHKSDDGRLEKKGSRKEVETEKKGSGEPSPSAPAIPDGLVAVAGFVEEFARFAEHRKRLKKPMTEHAQALLLTKLAQRPRDAIPALQMAMENGWQGIEWDWFDKRRQGQPAKTVDLREGERPQITEL